MKRKGKKTKEYYILIRKKYYLYLLSFKPIYIL